MHYPLSSHQQVKPRILLVDNDPSARISYQALLLEWGYDPVLAMGIGSSLLEDARKKARECCCSLALVDLRLKDDDNEDDQSGADFAESIRMLLKPIILTGTEDPNALRRLLQKHRDIPYIGKQDRRDEFRKRLDAEAATVSAAKRQLQFDQAEMLDDFMKSDLVIGTGTYSDQVADILARLFPNGEKIRFEKISGWTEVSDVSSAIRPNSVVLKVYEDSLEPCIIKLARASKIEHEVKSYYEYISRKLTGSFSAQLLQSAILWDIGGAAYTYISGNGTRTFAAYYNDQSIQNIIDVLRSFFFDVWGKYYKQAQQIRDISLFELYSKVWGEDWYEKCERELNPQAFKRSEHVLKSFNLPNPMDWLQQKKAASSRENTLIFDTKTAVTHGDLHGDNLMVDDRKNVWVIDFERCGKGHVLQDFIELEADILNRLIGHQFDLSSYFKMCLTVFKQQSIKALAEDNLISRDVHIEKALRTISTIREFASQSTETSDAREYLYGLLFNTIFRAALVHKTNPKKSELPLLLAGFICHRIDHWNQPWPPAEWNII